VSQGSNFTAGFASRLLLTKVLAFDDVEARNPRRPWVPAELAAVLHMLTGLAAS
jgi:hypothetical protein